MPLGVYEETSPGVYAAHSSDGAQTNPVTTVHHGRNGDIVETKLFVSPDNANSYAFISIKAVSLSADLDIGSGSSPGDSGWGVKFVEGDDEPSENTWDATNYGNTITFSAISSQSTYSPFWYRIESPLGERVKNKDNISIVVMFTES